LLLQRIPRLFEDGVQCFGIEQLAERLEDESPSVHARVGDDEPAVLAFSLCEVLITIQQQIQVDRARTETVGHGLRERMFDGSQELLYLFGWSIRFDRSDGVTEVRLVRVLLRRGSKHVRETDSRPVFAQELGGTGEVGFRIDI